MTDNETVFNKVGLKLAKIFAIKDFKTKQFCCVIYRFQASG